MSTSDSTIKGKFDEVAGKVKQSVAKRSAMRTSPTRAQPRK